MNRSIEIVIAADGGLNIEAVGFKGADCEKATEFLEKALGVVGQKKRKSEYYSRSTNRSRQSLKGGSSS